MTQEKINRINELARKAKTPEGLTEEELKERDILRREYIDSFKASLVGQLENTYIVDEKVTRRRSRETLRSNMKSVKTFQPYIAAEASFLYLQVYSVIF